MTLGNRPPNNVGHFPYTDSVVSVQSLAELKLINERIEYVLQFQKKNNREATNVITIVF